MSIARMIRSDLVLSPARAPRRSRRPTLRSRCGLAASRRRIVASVLSAATGFQQGLADKQWPSTSKAISGILMPLRTTITGNRMVFDGDGKPYTLYDIHCQGNGGRVWRTEMRYSDFKKLAQGLSDRHRSSNDGSIAPPEIPKSINGLGSWLAGLSGAESPEFVKKRAVGLQGWLDLLTGLLDETDPLLLAALGAPNQHGTPPRTSTSLHGEEQRHPPSPRGPVPSSDRSESGRVEPSHAVQPPASLSGNLAWQLVWEAPPEVDCDAPL